MDNLNDDAADVEFWQGIAEMSGVDFEQSSKADAELIQRILAEYNEAEARKIEFENSAEGIAAAERERAEVQALIEQLELSDSIEYFEPTCAPLYRFWKFPKSYRKVHPNRLQEFLKIW
jgi:aspartyl/asparaginyl-tRNA synthetase